MILCPKDYDFKNEDPVRYRLCQQGGIIAVLAEDVSHRLWFVGYPGVDLLACLITAPSGVRHLMGRVRIHNDDRVHNSTDDKLPLHVILPSGDLSAHVHYGRETCKGLLARLGFTGNPLGEIDLAGGGGAAIADAIAEIAARDSNWSSSSIALGLSGEESNTPEETP